MGGSSRCDFPGIRQDIHLFQTLGPKIYVPVAFEFLRNIRARWPDHKTLDFLRSSSKIFIIIINITTTVTVIVIIIFVTVIVSVIVIVTVTVIFSVIVVVITVTVIVTFILITFILFTLNYRVRRLLHIGSLQTPLNIPHSCSRPSRVLCFFTLFSAQCLYILSRHPPHFYRPTPNHLHP